MSAISRGGMHGWDWESENKDKSKNKSYQDDDERTTSPEWAITVKRPDFDHAWLETVRGEHHAKRAHRHT